MGVGIIAMFLGGGWTVDVVSRSASTREGLPAALAKALAGMGKPTDTSGLRTFATLPEADWSKIDIAVETVTETEARSTISTTVVRTEGLAVAAIAICALLTILLGIAPSPVIEAIQGVSCSGSGSSAS